MRRTLAAALVAGTLLLAAACNQGTGTAKPAASGERELRTIAVENGTVEVTLREVAVVEALNTQKVQSPFKGNLLTVIASGTRVKAGDIIATVDPTSVQDDVIERTARLRELKNDYEQAIESLTMEIRSSALDVDAAAADLEFQRMQLEEVNIELSQLALLHEQAIVAKDEVTNAANASDRTKLNTVAQDLGFRSQKTTAAIAETGQTSRIDRALVEAGRVRGRLDERLDELEASKVKAPRDGLFVRHSTWKWQSRRNEEVQTGDDLDRGQLIGTVQDPEDLTIRSQIPESAYLRIEVGTPVELHFESVNLRVNGRVSKIAPFAIERERSPGGLAAPGESGFTGEKVFEVTITPEEKNPALRPGFTGRGRYILQRSDSVLAIPVTAVWTQGQRHVVALRQGKSWVEREVKLGLRGDTDVEVLDGLRTGDTILATDPRRVLSPAGPA